MVQCSRKDNGKGKIIPRKELGEIHTENVPFYCRKQAEITPENDRWGRFLKVVLYSRLDFRGGF